MSNAKRLASIVLAAGTSSRLGQPKQLLPLDGQPLLRRTLDLVCSFDLEPRIVVLGSRHDKIAGAVDLTGFETIFNPDYESGIASSLQAGLAALPDSVDGAIVFLGDQPLVPRPVIRQIVESFVPGEHAAIRPNYADPGPGNPVLLSREIFPELMQLSGDVGAREVLRQHRSRVLTVDARRYPTPRDVDTMEDYAALKRDWLSLGSPMVPEWCQQCGGRVYPEERHDRLRPVCADCGFTYFVDPKLVVAVIVEVDGGIVMLRRAIDPGRGKWTVPSGFVDRGEDVYGAAAREVEEESGLRVEDLKLLDAYSEDGETVVLLVFTAKAPGQTPQALDEASAVGVFKPGELPELAFPRDGRIITAWAEQR